MYTDLWEKFQASSFKVHQYMFIDHIYDSNAVLERVMKSRPKESMHDAYNTMYSYLTNKYY